MAGLSVGFIGAGKMAQALSKGFVAAGRNILIVKYNKYIVSWVNNKDKLVFDI